MAHRWQSIPRFTSSLAVGSYFGYEVIIKLLLEAKADVNSKDDFGGRTPLSWAAENGHEGIVKLLLEAKANINSKDDFGGQTPLSWAAENGNKDIVKLLLEAKADVNLEDNNGRTSLRRYC
jgi:ankyrin repeat protein